ncbi:MAG: hypothetical protein KDN22_15345 [Verrucomicrobiae bacterium]|nr:hypothetical protein [Verrucomicrobiae bacterium]
MKFIHSIYAAVYDDLSLKTAGIILGILLIAGHIFAFLKREELTRWLKKMPRDKGIGVVILTIDFVWSWILISSMDLGEFQGIRQVLQIAIPVTYLLVINCVDEFLAVRALGVLLLLAATPVLDAAFLEMPITRLLLPLLAYAWIIIGLFWVGMPYVLRDQIAWVSASESRWKGACAGGIGYGLLMLICAVVFYGTAAG